MSTTAINEQLFDNKLTQLERARNWSPRVISKLETMIRTADDYSLFRINPMQFAAEKGLSDDEAIDLFLFGTKFGLFEMEWYLVCSSCGQVVESFRELTNLHSHFTCNFCSAQQEANLDDYIQVAFTVSTQVRDNSFRHPETLSAEDFYLRYQRAKGITTRVGNQPWNDVKFARVMTYVPPREKFSIEFNAVYGLLLIADLSHNTGLRFYVGNDVAPEVQPIVSSLADNKLRALNRSLDPFEYPINPLQYKFEQIGALDTGKVYLEIDNQLDERSPIWVCNFPDQKPPEPLQFAPFLSGKRLLTTQTFRDLFRSEVIQTSEGIGVKDITFLFTDLKGSTALYDQIGDTKAYFLVRQHFDTLGRVISQHSGAIVKTIGDSVMATFMSPLDAVKAAVEMLKEIEEFNKNIAEDLILKVGIHKGHSIVVTLNDRLDYFGQTVNIASRVQGLAAAGEIYVSGDAYNAPGVAEALAGCAVNHEQASVKGVSEKLDVYRITVERHT